MQLMKAKTLVFAALLSGCAGAYGIAPPGEDAPIAPASGPGSSVSAPPIRDIVTPFDEALVCLRPSINKTLAFAVGAIVDYTGKEQLTDGGAGKFVTQGAGDIVQSALFKAGATVINRRDPRVMTTEVDWKIRDPRKIVPSNFFITGSINSLDFIPGGGFDVSVAGVGPRYRQNRLLIGLDLSMTDANTGRIVANVPLQKQIVATEIGVGVGRFFGETLVSLDIGGREREALHFALRQMLYLATFDLLTQLMSPVNYANCREVIDAAFGVVEHTGPAEAVAMLEQKIAADAAQQIAAQAALNGGKAEVAAAPAAAVKPNGSFETSQVLNPVTQPVSEPVQLSAAAEPKVEEPAGDDGPVLTDEQFYWEDGRPSEVSKEETATILQ